MNILEYCAPHQFCKDNKIKEDEIGGACSTNGYQENPYIILVGKHEVNRTTCRHTHGWNDSIEAGHKGRL
jgi:hypothetical protein